MKKLIIIGVVAVVGLGVVGGAGFLGYKMHSELARYKALGSYASMQKFSRENFDLNKQNKAVMAQMDEIQRELIIYRKNFFLEAEKRSARKIATSVAAFQQLSGPYVLTAAATQEQLELCQDTQALMQLEIKLFQTNDPEAMARQEKVCGTYIAQKLIPLFKYQMLRNRVNLSGSMGHLKADAERKFDNARQLLKKWEIPVERELESYTRFDR